jgi:hypothetical protein
MVRRAFKALMVAQSVVYSIQGPQEQCDFQLVLGRFRLATGTSECLLPAAESAPLHIEWLCGLLFLLLHSWTSAAAGLHEIGQIWAVVHSSQMLCLTSLQKNIKAA